MSDRHYHLSLLPDDPITWLIIWGIVATIMGSC